jgi:hypothetical protein
VLAGLSLLEQPNSAAAPQSRLQYLHKDREIVIGSSGFESMGLGFRQTDQP